MADVRAQSGVPVAAQFGGLATPTMCAPLVVDSATGIIYSLKTGDVVVAAGGGLTTVGTGVITALGVNVGSAGAFVTFNGAGGTPSSMTATNLSGTAASLTAGVASAVAVGGITGLGTGVGTLLATPTSANLAAALTDEIGSGKAVFGSAVAAWTPTGNGVTLTVNSAGFVTLGGMVFANFDVTWPTTIDGGAAEIRSLPVTSNASYRGATIFGFTDYGAAFLGDIPAGGTAIALSALTGVAITNVSVSTKRFVGVAVYAS